MRNWILPIGLILFVPALKAQTPPEGGTPLDTAAAQGDSVDVEEVVRKHVGLFSISGSVTNLANWNPGGEKIDQISFGLYLGLLR